MSTEVAYDAATEFMNRDSFSTKVQNTLHRYPWLSSAIVLAIALVVFGRFNENFLTPNNFSLILQQVAIVGAVAAGQTIIILTAGIDLSCGAIAVFASMTMAKLVQGTPGAGHPADRPRPEGAGRRRSQRPPPEHRQRTARGLDRLGL